MTDPRHTGRYTIAQAARLARLHPSRVRRWLGVSGEPATVIRHAETPVGLVSFLDLIELEIVRALLHEGFEIRKLREAVRDAAARLKVDHPLAQKRFLVGDTRLFLEDTHGVIELGSGGQAAFETVVRQRSRVLDFAKDGLAARWWPLGHHSIVVIDPVVAWGEPSVAGTRWTTHALAQAVRAQGGDQSAVAEDYGLEIEQIRRALEYEGLVAA